MQTGVNFVFVRQLLGMILSICLCKNIHTEDYTKVPKYWRSLEEVTWSNWITPPIWIWWNRLSKCKILCLLYILLDRLWWHVRLFLSTLDAENVKQEGGRAQEGAEARITSSLHGLCFPKNLNRNHVFCVSWSLGAGHWSGRLEHPLSTLCVLVFLYTSILSYFIMFLVVCT